MRNTLTHAIDAVLALESLSPSEHVNQTMSNLVHQVIDNTDSLPSESLVQSVRKKSADAEGEMEQYWAKRIATSTDPKQEVQLFPYRHNYSELVRREVSLIADSGFTVDSKHAVLIIGSGPLPLTAIEIGQQTGARVDQIDISSDAADSGRSLCEVLDFPTQYYVGDGQDTTFERDYDVILIAALAGETLPQKQAIVNNALKHLTYNGRIVIRSATGLRTVLYPEIKGSDVTGLELLNEYHPDDDIINSVLVYKAA